MFEQILVALDHSTASQQVFEKALSIAKTNQSNLILLHVLSTEESDSPMMSPYLIDHRKRCIHVPPRIMRQANEVFDREWSNFTHKGLEILRTYAQKAIAAGVKTEFEQIMGHPGLKICDFARSCQADVIVVGRRGHSGLKEMFIGSVSNYVVHHAPCSVLLVHTPKGDAIPV